MAPGIESLTPEQQAFLTRYLGARRGASGETATAPKALPVWMAARETADQQIDALQKRLRSETLPLFQKIADAGLHGVTDGQLSRLQAALMDLDRTSGPAREGAVVKARTAMDDMRSFLATNTVLPILERNPFGVSVSVRTTLGDALTELDRIVVDTA